MSPGSMIAQISWRKIFFKKLAIPPGPCSDHLPNASIIIGRAEGADMTGWSKSALGGGDSKTGPALFLMPTWYQMRLTFSG